MGSQQTFTPIQKLYAILVMCLFAIPNVYYVVRGGEDYPFTCAPMFGHYIGEGTRFYSFKFIGESDGSEKVLRPQLGNLSEIATMRFFFSKVYGSCENYSPFGNHPDDCSRAFSERLSRYFKGYLATLPQTERTNIKRLNKLRLEVWRYNRNDEIDQKHIVGYYTISTEKFTHQRQGQ